MADVFSKQKRSEVMSRIRSRGNEATELALAKLLRRNKISGWRRQVQIGGRDAALLRPRPKHRAGRNERRLTLRSAARTAQRAVLTFRVRPDFVFKAQRLALFVDGCFWHGCPRHGTRPRGNAAFWKRKFAANLARDRRVNRALRRANWNVLRVWEHDLHRAARRQATRGKTNEARLVRRIQRVLNFYK